MKTAVLPATLLLLVVSGILVAGYSGTCFTVLVTNSVTPTPDKTYHTCMLPRGILLGGLRRLQEKAKDFTFSYTEDKNYGPFLESVNGLPGSTKNHTFWQLLVKHGDKPPIPTTVGIGCCIPDKDDQIILKYTKY